MERLWRRGLYTLMILCLGNALAWSAPKAYTVRFSDMPEVDSRVAGEAEAPTVSANRWLRKKGWEQVWPVVLIGKGKPLDFAGPPENRFLRVAANDTFFIWGKEVKLDPQQFPVLELVWGVEAFADGAAMDLYERNDRAIVVQVLFGDKLPTSGLPDLAAHAGVLLGAKRRPSATTTPVCSPERGPQTHGSCAVTRTVKYLALRSGGEGRVFTDRVNLLKDFREQFPEYWREHRQAPSIVGLSFEAQSAYTKSRTSARLYSIRLLQGLQEEASN